MQNQPLRLDRPRLLQNQEQAPGRRAFYLFMLLLGGLSAFGCVATAFHLPVLAPRLILTGLACAGFWLWRHMDQTRRWRLASLLGWAVWLVFLIFLFEEVLQGALRTLNLMLNAYGQRLNYELPVLTLPGLPRTYHSEEECTAFLGILLFPFFWWLSRMLVKRKSPLGAFCLTAVFLLLPMGFSILPAGWAYGGILLFWCSLLLTALPLTGRKSAVLRRGRFQASGSAGGAMLLVPLAVLASLLAVYWASPPETYSRPDLVNQLRQGVTEGFGLSSLQGGGQGSGNNRVELSRMGGRHYSGKTMLRVKFDWEEEALTQKEYLKSFVGSVYTGSSWERPSAAADAALDDIGLQAQTLPARYRRDMYTESIDEPGGYRLAVENLGANPRCVYIPYGLAADADLSPYGAELVGDGFAKSGNFFAGTKEYQLEGITMPWGWRYFDRATRFLGGSLQMPASISIFFEGALEGMGISTTNSEEEGWPAGTSGSAARWTERRRRFTEQLLEPDQREHLTSYLGESYAVDLAKVQCVQWLAEDMENQERNWNRKGERDLWKAPDWFRELFDPEPAALMAAVEDYTDFAYEYYTQVPEELAEFLDRYREAFSLRPDLRTSDSLDVKILGQGEPLGELSLREHPLSFAGRVAMVFQQYYTYTLDPPQPGRGQDFVEFFLDSSRQGYCVHFATAAVMLLRSAGYPARYAEGYVAPSGEAGWVEVPDYNAHAWLEVYCAGTGWTPVEVTPPSPDAPAVYANARVPEFSDAQTPAPRPDGPMPTLPPRATESPRQAEASAAPRATREPLATPAPGANAAREEAGPSWALPAALSLLAVAGALLLNRWLRRRSWRKALGQPDRNRAALKAYALIMKRYGWQALCGQREDPPARWKELAEKARFGPGPLPQEELDELLDAAEALRQTLRKQLPKLHLARCWLAGLI